jgi:protein-ribulosamine 3-kinase
MDPPQRFAALANEFRRLNGQSWAPQPARRCSGGSIHECYAWPCGGGLGFVKLAAPAAAEMLAAEADGLEALAQAHALRVPRVLARGVIDAGAFLALEWIESVPGSAAAAELLGTGLARQHAVSAARFGFARDNFIGRTPQTNTWTDNWAEFFCERRLRPQFALAAQRADASALEARSAALLQAVPALLEGHAPRPALLHGDLWAGNFLVSAGGEPVVFDPAVYYGDREADLAMTRLFGGFAPDFYRAYRAAAPLPSGWQRRAELYNLYHVLNHANLFGGGYAPQACALIDRLLA